VEASWETIQFSGKPVGCDLSLLRAGEEKLFGEIVEFEEAMGRRWGSELVGRGDRRKCGMSAPFGK
jgi:hypothetical protein